MTLSSHSGNSSACVLVNNSSVASTSHSRYIEIHHHFILFTTIFQTAHYKSFGFRKPREYVFPDCKIVHIGACRSVSTCGALIGFVYGLNTVLARKYPDFLSICGAQVFIAIYYRLEKEFYQFGDFFNGAQVGFPLFLLCACLANVWIVVAINQLVSSKCRWSFDSLLFIN